MSRVTDSDGPVMWNKLWAKITASSVWEEELHVRVVWIALIASAGQDGIARVNPAAVYRLANVTKDQAEDALDKLQAPDPNSTTQVEEGRRIKLIPGEGIFLINHGKHHIRTPGAERQARYRQRQASPADGFDSDATGHNGVTTRQDKTRPDQKEDSSGSASEPSDIKLARYVFSYWQEKLDHKRAKLDGARRSRIRARLKDFSPDQLRKAIDGVALSDWHMGRDPKTGGKRYDDFKTIFRDAEQVEKFIDIAEGKQSGAVQSGSAPAFEPTASLRALAERTGVDLAGVVKRLSASLSWQERSIPDQIGMVGREILREAKRRAG